MNCTASDTCRAGRGNHLPTCPRIGATRGGRPGRRGAKQVSVSITLINSLREAMQLPESTRAAEVLSAAEARIRSTLP